MTTEIKTASVTKATPSGKTAEIYYTNTAPMSQRFEVFVDGVSGGKNSGPKVVKIGLSARTAKSTTVISWGDKMIELTAAEAATLGGIEAPRKVATAASKCRVCGQQVVYSEQGAKYGYCGCEG